MNLYFLKLSGNIQKKFAPNLPDGFPLPIASEESQDHVLKNLSEEDVIRGLLHVIIHLDENPNRDDYVDILKRLRPDLPVQLSQVLVDRVQAQDWVTGEEIVIALTSLQEDDPRSSLQAARFFEERAAFYARAENWEQANEDKILAKKWYHLAVTTEPLLPAAYSDAGYFYLNLGEIEKCEEIWSEYLEITDDEKVGKALEEVRKRRKEDELFKTAYDHILMGNEEKGILDIDLFLGQRQDVWNAWFLKGWALRRLERYDEALENFKTSLSFNPGHPDTLNELALCYFHKKDFKSAKNFWFQALKKDPQSTKILCNLGVLSQTEGKMEEAKTYFLTALEFTPEDLVAQKYLNDLDSL